MSLCGRPASGLALIAALVLALGVAACGRKGGLDPPPGASVAGAQPAAAATATDEVPAATTAETERNKSISGGLGVSASSKRTRTLPPPPAPKRDLVIDNLLN